MESAIRALLTDDILCEAASMYGYRKEDLSDLHGFQNFVYEARNKTGNCIIRIAHSSHRSIETTEAELDWILYLHSHGVNAAAPIKSLEGSLINKINHGDSYFVVTAFNKAAGAKPHNQDFMDDKMMIQKLGKITGKIHALTKKYTTKPDAILRPAWVENNYLVKFADYMPESHASLVNKTNEFINKLKLLPKDAESYELIHGDIHFNNFHVHENELTLFDFDECEYNWFAADIANPLFYVTPLPSDGKELRNQTAQRFYNHYMEGYSQENSLNTAWLKRIPVFLRLREILVYSGAFRSLDLNNLHPWSKEMIENTTNNIENDLPYLDIDFV